MLMTRLLRPRQRTRVCALAHTVEMSQVMEIRSGAQSPLVAAAEKGRKRGGDDVAPAHLTFSLIAQDETSLADFVCDEESHFSEWIDGFRAALDKEMAQPQTSDLVKTLEDVDVKISTTDIRLHKVSIPDSTPAVPAPPADLDFVFAVETL